MTIASDHNGFQLPSKLLERQKTLQLWANVRKDGNECIWLRGINLVDLEQGEGDAFSSPSFINLVPDAQQRIGIPREAFTQIMTMPICGSHVPTKDQIKCWGEYLGIEKRTAEKKQFCVPFVNHNHSNLAEFITFTIEVTSATSDSSTPLSPDDFWQRAKQANDDIKLFKKIEEIKHTKSGQRLGTIEKVERNKNQIKIKINSSLKEGDLKLPDRGYLFFEDIGSLSQIRWQEKALKNLREGHTKNCYLGEFFFDASRARPIRLTTTLSKTDLLLKEANTHQIEAVQAVLDTEDLILIQGPPGTGKTTVIAEICYQVAMRGGRTLIASQANLAVDNALSRLSHHPLLRPLREGNLGSKVGKEGESFLEHNVIDRWLEKTAFDCEKRLINQKEITQGLSPLLTSLQEFYNYVETETNFPLTKQALQDNKINLEREFLYKNTEIEILKQKYDQDEHFKSKLDKILESNDIFLADQVKKLQSARDYQAEIVTAISEVGEWKKNANVHIYYLLKHYLKERKVVTQDLLTLPKMGFALIKKTHSDILPWHDTCEQLLSDFNQLSIQWNNWDNLCKVANQVYWLIIQSKSYVENQNPSASYVSQIVNKIRDQIDINQPLRAIRQILHATQKCVSELENSQDLHKNAAILKAISQIYQIIRDQNQPVKSESILNGIAADYVVEVASQFEKILSQLRHSNYPRIKQLESSIDKIEKVQNPFQELFKIQNYLSSQLDNTHQNIVKVEKESAEIQERINKCNQEIERIENDLRIKREWWEKIWQAIPSHLKVDGDIEIFSHDFLNTVPQNFEAWQKQLTESQSYLIRYEPTLQKWIDRLRQPSEEDISTISKEYLDNVNVVGVTCIKAAKWDFSQRFSQFDVVIIDEVSKSTPPELLIPALKGKKVVMIGDYRQLPPILDEENLDELAEELSVPREKLEFLETSWFKQQFESATNAQIGIAKKLNIQYRMHPQIMEAINQFYDDGDGGLICGLTDPNNQRAHHLESSLINKDQHIIWLKMPRNESFREEKKGTSYQNTKEVDEIEKVCEHMNQTWKKKVIDGEPRKEIGIITFYGAQLQLIDERINRGNRFPNLDIRTGTVDRFQGMEKSVIIVSMVRNNSQGIVGFAKTSERVNVAFSRAKELLVIIGCHDLFIHIPIYQKVSEVVERHGGFLECLN